MASKATRALKSAVKLRRFRVIPVSPGNPILHLSHLSSFWGAPQRARLDKGNLKGQTWADLEAKAGVGDGTIRKFAKGSTEQPSLITLLSLSVVTASRESVR